MIQSVVTQPCVFLFLTFALALLGVGVVRRIRRERRLRQRAILDRRKIRRAGAARRSPHSN